MAINVISNTTGKEMTDALKAIAATIAADKSLANITWKDIALYADNGIISNVLAIGDQVVEKWTDKAPSEAVEYECPMDLVSVEDIELEDGTTLKNRPIFQTHWLTKNVVQFSGYRAFVSCLDGLAAGKYYVTLESAWGSNVSAGDIVCFELTQNVPSGGRIGGMHNANNTKKADWKVYSYAADGKTLIETVTPTFTADGTSLGTLKLTKRATESGYGNTMLSCLQEAAYGSNRWATSALRQYLNSDAGKNAWWTPQDEWDIAPAQVATLPGYLTGFSSDFIAQLKPMKVVTYKNKTTYDGTADTTYDKVCIPALEQVYAKKEINGEGTVFPYWCRRIGGDTPQNYNWESNPKNANRIQYAIENHTSAQSARLRSATFGYSCDTWYGSSSGSIDSSGTSWAMRCSPIVGI